jgi:hypothetical protein
VHVPEDEVVVRVCAGAGTGVQKCLPGLGGRTITFAFSGIPVGGSIYACVESLTQSRCDYGTNGPEREPEHLYP